eukprot:3460489-Rhodomonas_salina.2
MPHCWALALGVIGAVASGIARRDPPVRFCHRREQHVRWKLPVLQLLLCLGRERTSERASEKVQLKRFKQIPTDERSTEGKGVEPGPERACKLPRLRCPTVSLMRHDNVCDSEIARGAERCA